MASSNRETTTRVERAGKVMTISIAGAVALPADSVLAAVQDFSERREEVFPAVSVKRLTVHSLADTHADATEGTRAGPFIFWERCDYDWSRPGRVTAAVTASNVYATPESSWELTATPSSGGSTVTMTWRRRFRRTPIGRFMGFVYRHFGKRAFTTYACEVLDNLETLASRAGATHTGSDK